MKKSRSDDARLMALRLLGAVLDDGAALAEAPENTAGDPRNRAYARHLAYGVLRWLSALEWLASQLLKKPLKQKDRDVQRLVLLGLFQLWKDDTAGHAAVHETAECARKLRKPWATGLINAVLRRFQREQEALLTQLDQVDDRFAHPQWLLQALKEDWPEDWQTLVRANNQAAPLWLRLNQAFDGPVVTAALQDDGLVVTSHGVVGSAFKVEPARAVRELPGFSQGKFSVQDPAAQLTAGLMRCEPGQRVLDACAAPGGKTCHLLECHPDIDLLALDRSTARLRQIEENIQRLGLSGRAQLLCADAVKPDDWWDGDEFDRILLDAPCSATGVIRRHPEIKWLRNPGQVNEAVAVQSALLATLWPLLKPGGILVYATCSVLKSENSGQVAAFLDQHPDAVAEFPETAWGRACTPGRQILPGEMEMDGFYYASLRKQA
ncbi:MAG: 16S rRNA (cytosine(967)-C(5))-methyltransferase RsmB [Xanthomonadales bacterium]|nr:16S rRNA (cytosine(967)-C(5))-methyltransferase RsmB [Xanthomonadales bacterium]